MKLLKEIVRYGALGKGNRKSHPVTFLSLAFIHQAIYFTFMLLLEDRKVSWTYVREVRWMPRSCMEIRNCYQPELYCLVIGCIFGLVLLLIYASARNSIMIWNRSDKSSQMCSVRLTEKKTHRQPFLFSVFTHLTVYFSPLCHYLRAGN